MIYVIATTKMKPGQRDAYIAGHKKCIAETHKEKGCLAYEGHTSIHDPDTYVVTYDTQRGEPRGSRSRNADFEAQGLGACVDCSICVQVCPTGIDIRQGLQYECIGCGACIDACDQVMDKMRYPRGLIRYTSERAICDRLSAKEARSHLLRPRVLIHHRRADACPGTQGTRPRTGAVAPAAGHGEGRCARCHRERHCSAGGGIEYAGRASRPGYQRWEQ